MFNHDEFNANRFVISYELLTLLTWIIEHEDKILARLVKKAFNGGLKHHIKGQPATSDAQLAEDAQQTIIDFFGILESHMLDVLDEDTAQHAMEKNLLPAIDQIDTMACDTITMRKSIETATHTPEVTTAEQAKEILCKELLRHWKPAKNQLMN